MPGPIGCLQAIETLKYLTGVGETMCYYTWGRTRAADIERVKGRIPCVHVKDMQVDRNRVQKMAEIGAGNLNWPAIFKAAEEVDVEWYFVEQDRSYERDPFESLAISYRNLKAMGLS